MLYTMDKQYLFTKNLLHLGDCIYSLIMFYNIEEYIKQNNIYIYFYCLNEHYEQIKDFIKSDNIIVSPINNAFKNVKIYDLWIGSSDYDYNWYSVINIGVIPHDVFFCKYYNNILKLINIPVTIQKFTYRDVELFKRCADINRRTNDKYMNVNFLVNNSFPRSGQFDYNILEFNQFVVKLSEKYNVVTTQKVENVKCTRDDNLTAKDIAAISLNIKNFIVIESGVIAGLYNDYITENPDVTVYKLSNCDSHVCSFNNFILSDSLSKLSFLIK